MHSHNVFLNVWVEVGIGGALALVFYNITTARASVGTYFNTTDKEIKHYIAAGLAGLAAFIMFSMVEHVWFYPRTMLAYFLMMGLVWATIRASSKAKENNV